MKKFSFSLARMLNYQEQILEKEKGTMGRLIAERDEMESRQGVILEQVTYPAHLGPFIDL